MHSLLYVQDAEAGLFVSEYSYPFHYKVVTLDACFHPLA